MGSEVQIEKLVYGGQGLGRVEGRVVLVPFVIPGERVEVEVVRETRGLWQARAVAWPTRSASRITPECPIFERCGGCHYQHIPHPEQLEFKRQILIETLSRVGKIRWDGPIETVAGSPWQYRNRTQLHVVKRRSGGGRDLLIGFREAGSHRIVPADACPINSPVLNRVHRSLVEMAQERRFPRFLQEIEFFTNETDVQVNVRSSSRPLAKSFFDWCAERIDGFAGGAIDYPCGKDVFRVSGRSFFQVNRFLLDELTRTSLGDASGALALDLYAGVGLFTLPLARRFERAIAVDTSRAAVRDLQFNAERAGIEIHVVHLGVAEYLATLDEDIDFVVADPPRAGVGPNVTRELLRLKPRTVVMVSCDPSTLARDLAALCSGGYRIDTVTLVDLFPQTFHLETVVWLSS